MSDTDQPEEQAAAGAGGGNKALKSAGFFGVIAVVVGVFAYLSSLDHPPDLPGDAVHKFRFNVEGQLIGLASEAEGDAPEVAHTGLDLDKKGIEKRVNALCATCHGKPFDDETKQPIDLTSHSCQGYGICVPVGNHPPKNTCIKCHRHAGN
jgi:hypothetical protein